LINIKSKISVSLHFKVYFPFLVFYISIFTLVEKWHLSSGSESTLTQETLKMMPNKQPTWWKSSPRRLRPGNRRGASLYDVGWKPHNRRNRVVLKKKIQKKKFRIFQNRFDKSPIHTNNNHNNFQNFLTSIN